VFSGGTEGIADLRFAIADLKGEYIGATETSAMTVGAWLPESPIANRKLQIANL
jgi:hypothetical protein